MEIRAVVLVCVATSIGFAGFAGFAPAVAIGQVVARDQYAEEPTDGVATPLSPLAGDYDALATVTNPAGLRFLGGSHLGLLLHLDDGDNATSGGAGLGVFSGYGGGGSGGGLIPRFGFGLGVELLRPERVALLPDPGNPTRFTIAGALALGDNSSFGVSWHRYFDDPSHALHDVGTWDAGLATRWGSHLAFGLVVRDLGRPSVGGAPVQRRYEGELAVRPLETERLELTLGGRIGETRGDIDAWVRTSWRVARGVAFKTELLAQSLQRLSPVPGGFGEDTVYEGRITAGFEISFGKSAVTSYATVATDDDGGNARLQSGSLYLSSGPQRRSPLLGEPDRIEKVELVGALGDRRLTELVLALRTARKDPAVVAVFVQIDGLEMAWSDAREVREALLELRAAGKRVYAFLLTGATRDYYVASAANKIFLDPAWGLRLDGFAATTVYYKGILDQLGVRAEFEKIEEYKSAPEAYTRQEPSEAAERMTNIMYDDIYATVVSEIAASRGVTVERFRALVDGGPYDAGKLAEMPELIDQVVSPDDVGDAVAADMGRRVAVLPRPRTAPEYWDSPSIAVIYIDGNIVAGKSQSIPIPIPLVGTRQAGAKDIIAALAWARSNPDIDAIVLRVNSPGGLAVASELIAREVFRTRGIKPIICSMGGVAASGGYFVSTGCDVIFAEPTTITGSIGIFTGKVDLSALLDRLGVTWKVYKRGAGSDRESFFHGYTMEDRTRVREQLRYVYDRFVGYVARGRSMEPSAVDEVGRGRVWTGRMAKEVHLVDELGGVADALAYAKRAAGIPEDRATTVVMLPKITGDLLSQLSRFAGLPFGEQPSPDGSSAMSVLQQLLAQLPLSLWLQPDAPQALLPFAVQWQ